MLTVIDGLATMTINPYLPPRASQDAGEMTWRPNPLWRVGNWLYGMAMLVFVFFVVRGGSLTPDSSTLATLAVFLAPVAGYSVSVSIATDRRYQLWRITHLVVLCFLLWLIVDDAMKGAPIPPVGWWLLVVNGVSFASNEIYHRGRVTTPAGGHDGNETV